MLCVTKLIHCCKQGSEMMLRPLLELSAAQSFPAGSCAWPFSYSLRHTAGWSAVPDYFVGPAFFRGRLWIEHQPQDTFLKLQASPCPSPPFLIQEGLQKLVKESLVSQL